MLRYIKAEGGLKLPSNWVQICVQATPDFSPCVPKLGVKLVPFAPVSQFTFAPVSQQHQNNLQLQKCTESTLCPPLSILSIILVFLAFLLLLFSLLLVRHPIHAFLAFISASKQLQVDQMSQRLTRSVTADGT